MSIGKALARSLKVLPRNPKSKQNRERGHPGGPSWRNVGYWHKADMLNALTNVRFWGQSGH